MSDVRDVSLTRRAAVRLALWGAAGLSLLPSCRRQGSVATAPTQPPADPGVLAKWAELGRIWREMNALSVDTWRSEGDLDRRSERLYSLSQELDAALEALPAWPELRFVLEERARHLRHYELGAIASCYLYSGPVCEEGGKKVAERINELRELKRTGALTDAAVAKAGEALARDAEFLAGVYDERGDYSERDDEWGQVVEAWENGTLQPTPEATLAGWRTVELTIDDLGRLAGPPQENEGFEDAPAADEEDDQ